MQTDLRSFDGNENARAELLRPDRYRHLFESLSSARSVIPRGAGLSYCGASAADGVVSVSSELFNRLLGFDPATGVVSVEPGYRIGDLLRFAVGRGWYPPVMPGHPRITVGGCVGFNIHGKSQFHGGCFRSWVERLFVFHPDHGEVECSPSVRPELFELTIGGFGLTGFITRIDLRLARLKGNGVRLRRVPVGDLVEAARVLEEQEKAGEVLYSWHDLNRGGDAFGQGVIYVENFETVEKRVEPEWRKLTPDSRASLKINLYNRLTVPLIMRAYGIKERAGARESLLDLSSAAFPLNGKEIYFKFFGRPGLREYQFVVPSSRWPALVPQVRQLIRDCGTPVTLGSLKLFRGERKLLDFSDTGICLALDVPAGEGSLRLFDGLDRLVLEAGGILNLSKDSRARAGIVRQMYPGYEEFKRRLGAWDPKRRFDSALRRRLEL